MRQKFDMQLCVAGQLAAKGYKFDAGETASFARELEYIQAQALEYKFPEFKALQLVPVKTDAPLGARSHTWREVQGFGSFDLLENLGTEDFPTADVQGAENTGTFRSFGGKYAYTIEDLRAAQMMSINVDDKKARTIRQAAESALDKAVMLGAGPFKGLLDDTMSVNDSAVSGVTADWTSATAIQIADSFRAVADKVFTDTLGVWDGLDFVLTPKAYTYLGKQLNTYNDKTVGDYIMSTVPRVRSISWSSRGTAQGAGGKDRMLAYPRNPDVLEAYVPIRFEQFAPQLSGMQFEIFCHAKFGGVRQYHPAACRRFDLTV